MKQMPPKKRGVRSAVVRYAHPRRLADSRRAVSAALKILNSIPPHLLEPLGKENKQLSDDIYATRQERELAYHLGGLLGYLARIERPAAESFAEMRRALRETRHLQTVHVASSGPAKTGYIKELVLKYRMRPIPQGLRLAANAIRSSGDIYSLFKNLRYEPLEQVFVVHLGAGDRILSMRKLSMGTSDEAPCCPAEIFRAALLSGARAVIIVHNHPSGIAAASPMDLRLVEELCELGHKLRLIVRDFIIIGDEDFWSASNRGVIVGGQYRSCARPTAKPVRRGRPPMELPKAAAK